MKLLFVILACCLSLQARVQAVELSLGSNLPVNTSLSRTTAAGLDQSLSTKSSELSSESISQTRGNWEASTGLPANGSVAADLPPFNGPASPETAPGWLKGGAVQDLTLESGTRPHVTGTLDTALPVVAAGNVGISDSMMYAFL